MEDNVALVVGLAKASEIEYPKYPPFSPSSNFSELQFLPQDSLNHQEENLVYAAVRQSLYLAGLDADRFGTETWNPFGTIINPGDQVLLKPNFVHHEYSDNTKDCMVTHGSVIRAVLDYVYLAGGPTGHITIADAPEQTADFELILQQMRIPEIVDFYKSKLNYAIDVYDLRTVASVWDGKTGFLPPAKELVGDPSGYVSVDLGKDSELEPITTEQTRFGIAAYSLDALQERHRTGRHEYLVSRTVLNQNVIINLPKMKTHQKTGLTGSLKNLVGINGSKDWLPHYRLGGPDRAGDEHPPGQALVSANRSVKGSLQRQSRFLWNVARAGWRIIKWFRPQSSQLGSGAWYGNDTTWRMAHDLNKILSFADNDGQMHPTPQRKIFSVMDGIIAGQGNGPLDPTAKPTGIILAGGDSATIDTIVAQLMGYNWCTLPLVARFLQPPGQYCFTKFNGHNLHVVTESGKIPFTQLESLKFIRPPGWVDLAQ